MLKIIPMIMAFISLLNSTLSYFGIDSVVLSYIGCTSLLSISFIYLASYCFGFYADCIGSGTPIPWEDVL